MLKFLFYIKSYTSVFKNKLKGLVYLIHLIYLRFFSLFCEKPALKECHKSCKILILYHIPKGHSRYGNWNDGFTKAVDILINKYNYNIKLKNIVDVGDLEKEILEFDVILGKSGWNGVVDKELRKLKKGQKSIGLLISASSPPRKVKDLFFYDILFYETVWYEKFISMHPNKFLAFGVSFKKTSKKEGSKLYDYVTYGEFKFYKNYHKFINLPGKKISIGDYSTKEGLLIKEILENSGVTVIGHLSGDKLDEMLLKSESIFINTSHYGGGERVLLEAKYLGLKLFYNKNNKKLKELDEQEQQLDEERYSEQLNIGLKSIVKT